MFPCLGSAIANIAVRRFGRVIEETEKGARLQYMHGLTLYNPIKEVGQVECLVLWTKNSPSVSL